ncbi:hypothetical protein PC116_g28970 [Phytophthora cactorum]|nr:hypothetical protein PC114_g13526 [Phytophthora cactorum]KAG2959332.1 hypothetical protein PC119_g26743 [Phytophthora cactorum]KAG3024217.1 hypothetical protein PC120_g7162 [Phytophthora cactorum]KAG4222556.1 hypothetical protein PC116_g28970 [Phytophthora cactorum]
MDIAGATWSAALHAGFIHLYTGILASFYATSWNYWPPLSVRITRSVKTALTSRFMENFSNFH